ncbi:dihydrolipoamide acetyltransferase family protein [Halopenitus sp. H-Gu1]|uniref:dihydrolipoamide acetyltransferase family protein n=1 Tax=Halopenitus sp. H-Gu1 TaxID=3242697 RepID=UPI00359D9B28
MSTSLEEFSLPDVGEGIAEGELVTWLVDSGDPVQEDQPIAEVETDKALVEIPSPYEGTVRELHVEEGEIVPVGTVIVTVDVSGGDVDDANGEAETSGENESVEEKSAANGSSSGSDIEGPGSRTFAPPSVRRIARELRVDIGAVRGSGVGGRVTESDVRASAEANRTGEGDTIGSSAPPRGDSDDATEPAAQPRASGESSLPSLESTGRDRTLAVPATRRIAREEEVDIDDVPTDRTREGEPFVTAGQVREYAAAARREGTETSASTGGPTDTKAGRSDESARSGRASSESRSEETIPYRGVRRMTGERMRQSKFTAPHVSHHDTAEVTALVEARDRLRSKAEERGVRLTYLPFLIKAVIAGLKQYPILNSELRAVEEGAPDSDDPTDAEIVEKHYYDIGIAVDTDAGLLVPVVENADGMGLLELAATVNDLVERARARECSPDELRGSTFTLTNFGAIGGEYATPIINPPETAILGLGAIEHRPVAKPIADLDGAEPNMERSESRGGHTVVARETLPLSISIDHRVIDGAVAARFMNTVAEHLENPMLLLSE